LADLAACFAGLNDSNGERSIDECVAVCEIDPAAEWDQTVTLSMGLGSIGRLDDVGCGIWGRGCDITGCMVLQPKKLIDSIVLNVVVMKGEEFHKEVAVLKV
jgi:hypothetical protein